MTLGCGNPTKGIWRGPFVSFTRPFLYFSEGFGPYFYVVRISIDSPIFLESHQFKIPLIEIDTLTFLMN